MFQSTLLGVRQLNVTVLSYIVLLFVGDAAAMQLPTQNRPLDTQFALLQ